MESFTFQCTSVCTGYSSLKQVHWKQGLNASSLDSYRWYRMMKLFRWEEQSSGIKTEVSVFFTLAIWRWPCSFTWGMCKSLHSDDCGNGNCCIISMNIIGILRTKLVCTCIFFYTKLNMDLSKAFVVQSPPEPHLCIQTSGWVHESPIFQVMSARI